MKCKFCKENGDNFLIFNFNNKYHIICQKCIDKINSRANIVTLEEYILKAKEKKSQYNKKYKLNNYEKCKEINKKYRDKNKIKIEQDRMKLKEYMKEYNKKYRENNKEILKQKRKEKAKPKQKKNVDIKIKRMKANIRSMINKSFMRKGYKKNTKATKILGCDINFFTDYLLQTFKNKYGYEWDKIEPVDIDHIKPLKYAEIEEDIIKLCHYTNLQLLKRTENRKKSAKIM